MRLLTVEQLVDAISADSQRRNRELITLSNLIKDSRAHEQHSLYRVAVVFSYAHWEGFVKNSATWYIHHIAEQAPLLSRLRGSFQALATKNVLHQATTATKRIIPHIIVVQHLVEQINSTKFLSPGDPIDTESNLSWPVFENILETIAISKDDWNTHQGWFNDLVKQRCEIAHGTLAEVQQSYALDALDGIRKHIKTLSIDILNAAQNRKYYRT